MNEKQFYAKSAEIELSKSEAALVLARRRLESGFKKLQADLEKAERDLVKAKIVQDEEYDTLKLSVRNAELDVDRARAYAANTAEVAQSGFEQ